MREVDGQVPRQAHDRPVGLLGQTCLVVVAYYLVPVFESARDTVTWLRGAAALVLFLLAVWWISREVARTVHDSANVRLNRLLLVVVGGVAFFALADLVVARMGPGQFTGLETKTDALYFALTTLITVGYGDVHADGQLARGLVVVQMVFNVVVLASAARVLTGELAERSRAAKRPDRFLSPPQSDEVGREERS